MISSAVSGFPARPRSTVDDPYVRQRRLAFGRGGYSLLEAPGSGVPGKVVQGTAGEDQQGQGMLDGGSCRCADGSVAAPHPEGLGVRDGRRQPDCFGQASSGMDRLYMRFREYFLQGGGRLLREGTAKGVHHNAEACAAG